jgi:hypothetical protein
VDVTLKLYALDDTTCSSPIAEDDVSRGGDGSVEGRVWADAGPYRWQAVVAPGDLWQGAQSTCGAPESTTQVG